MHDAVRRPRRIYMMVLGAGLADLTWLLLFVIAWRRTPTVEAT